MVDVVIPVTTRATPLVSAALAVPPGLHRCSVVSNSEVFAVGRALDVLIEASFDGGGTWKAEAGGTGMVPEPAAVPPVHLGLSVSFGHPEDPYPTHVRVTLTPVGGAVTLGAMVTVS